jgi:hypothetical protein
MGAEGGGGQIQRDLSFGKSSGLDQGDEDPQQAQIDIVEPSYGTTPPKTALNVVTVWRFSKQASNKFHSFQCIPCYPEAGRPLKDPRVAARRLPGDPRGDAAAAKRPQQ